jgi:enolase-phosphatase E1
VPGTFLLASLARGSVVSGPVDESVGAILLDIEGTTTPIDFVYKVLFPYARSHANEFLKRHGSSTDIQQDLALLRDEHLQDMTQGLNPPALNNPQEPESFLFYIGWLIDRDRKSTALKSLEGKIWEEGYARGELRSQIFDDVAPALKRWQEQQKTIAIFSSGSILAQRLLFAHTTAGDLTKYLSMYFDTTIGPKTDPTSYEKIANTLQCVPSEIVFISDVVRELDAAASAGLQTLLSERPGNRPQPANSFGVIRSFREVCPE